MKTEPAQPVLQWFVRPWKSEDMPMLSLWWRARGLNPLPQEMLPPTGYIIEREGVPVSAMFAFLAVGVGVAHIEWILSAPGQTAGETRESLLVLLNGVKQVLRDMDYGVMIVNAPRAIAREARNLGFEVSSTENFNLIGTTR